MPRRSRALAVCDLRYLAIAAGELAIARTRHACEPTGQIILRLKEACGAAPGESSEAPANLDIARVAWAIGAASRRVPWRADCLIQVMAAERWLRRYDVATSFFLGVARGTNGDFKAHAWLSWGSIVVAGTGGAGFAPLILPSLSHETYPTL